MNPTSNPNFLNISDTVKELSISDTTAIEGNLSDIIKNNVFILEDSVIQDNFEA